MVRVRLAPAIATGLLALLALNARPSAAAVVYMGPNEGIKTLRQAFAAMRSGDTLIIRDGRYTGPDNAITLGQAAPVVPLNVPPSGSPSAYTIIRAEHEGFVTFDGEARISVFGLFLNVEPDEAVPEFAYIEFRGLKWVNPKAADASGQTAAVGFHRVNAHHVKFFRCGAMVADADPTYGTSAWAIETGHHLLFEECYAWGNGRYGFKIQDRMSNDPEMNDRWLGASQVILRRCVVRLDRALATRNPIAAYMSYNAASVEYQNCIAVDIDPAYFNAETGVGVFGGRYHLEAGYGWTVNNHWRGTLVLNTNNAYGRYLNASGAWTSRTNNDGLISYMLPNEDAAAYNSLTHAVAWDVPIGALWASSEGRWAGSPAINNLTVKLQKTPGSSSTVLYTYGAFQASTFVDPPPALIKNSLFISEDDQLDRFGSPRTVVNIARTDYSAYWTPSTRVTDANPYAHTVGLHDYSELSNSAVDPYTGTPGNGTPALRYMVRAEPGSDLYGTGENGSNRGATVLKRYGVSGTLWGEPGYNTLTEENLWPFPAEDQIRSAFRSYEYPGGPEGKRGFCADGQTLTNYVWGYLGNAVPPLGLTMTRGEDSVTLNWAQPADLALPTIVGFNVYRVDGGQRSLVGTVEGNATYTATVTGLDPALSYAFAMTTVDSQKGESGLSDLAILGEPAVGGVTGSVPPPDSVRTTPAVTWPTPAPIAEGTPLSGAELRAGAEVPGVFAYTPDAGTVLPAGVHTLSTVFTPADSIRYRIATASTTLVVSTAASTGDAVKTGASASVSAAGDAPAAAMPVITWPAPSPITEGTPLSGAELRAGAKVPGTFAYTPPAGTVLPAGVHTLSAVFTPAESALYTTAAAWNTVAIAAPSYELTVQRPAGGTIWAAGITCGTGGSDCQERMPTVVWLGLQATPDRGFVFEKWTGDCTGTSPSYALALRGERTCGGVFARRAGSSSQ